MKNLSKKEKIAMWISIVVVGFFFVFGGLVISIFRTGTLPGGATQASSVPHLGAQDIQVGTGGTAQVGDSVTVNYIGTLSDGTVFDSSVARNQPFTFTLGAGQVISGWDQGIVGMKVGGIRILTIPPELGYGSQTYGPIPGGSTLVFRVELVSVNHP